MTKDIPVPPRRNWLNHPASGLSLGLVLFCWSVFGYLQAEITTNMYLRDIPELEKMCYQTVLAEKSDSLEVVDRPVLRYTKLLEYEKFRGLAKAVCLFEQDQENLHLVLNLRQQTWSVVYAEKINSSGKFYWPFYI